MCAVLQVGCVRGRVQAEEALDADANADGASSRPSPLAARRALLFMRPRSPLPLPLTKTQT